MKQHFIIKNNQKHLLLFFAGWGMDETPFFTKLNRRFQRMPEKPG